MLMPEAAMDENHELVPGQNQVRPSRKIAPMKPESKAHRMQQLPHSQFRLCVRRPDSRH
jgi:hypothetical protein